MTKPIKFNLNCDGRPIRTLEDLRNNFSVEDILEYYHNGLLCRWLDVRGYTAELKKVKAITKNDDLQVIKELIRDLGVEIEGTTLEEDTYILRYQKEREAFIANYKEKSFEAATIVTDHCIGYQECIRTILESENNIALIKAAIKEIDENYHDLYDLDFRMLFHVFLSCAPMAVFVMLMRENMRGYYLPESGQEIWYGDCLDGLYWEQSQTYIKEDKSAMYKKLCELVGNYSELHNILGVNLREFAGTTEDYWQDIEPKEKRCLILLMEPGNFVRASNNTGGDMSASDINNQFVILDGIDYKSKNETHKLLYMEV